MRRFRPISRREQMQESRPSPLPGDDEEFNIAPYVQVSPARRLDDEEQARQGRRAPRRVRLSQLRVPRLALDLQFSLVLLVVFLIAGGVFGTLLNLGRIRDEVEAWWPLVLVVAAVLWMLLALFQRRETSFLGGAAFAGVGLSLLLDAQKIAAFEETLVGVVLVMVGLGIVVRGFLLRQQTA